MLIAAASPDKYSAVNSQPRFETGYARPVRKSEARRGDTSSARRHAELSELADRGRLSDDPEQSGSRGGRGSAESGRLRRDRQSGAQLGLLPGDPVSAARPGGRRNAAG